MGHGHWGIPTSRALRNRDTAQGQDSNKTSFMVGVSTTRGTVLKGRSTRGVENRALVLETTLVSDTDKTLEFQLMALFSVTRILSGDI